MTRVPVPHVIVNGCAQKILGPAARFIIYDRGSGRLRRFLGQRDAEYADVIIGAVAHPRQRAFFEPVRYRGGEEPLGPYARQCHSAPVQSLVAPHLGHNLFAFITPESFPNVLERGTASAIFATSFCCTVEGTF